MAKNKENNLKIPKDTRNIINRNKIDNFNLFLNKYALFDANKGYKIQNQKIYKDFFKKNWNKYKEFINNYYYNIKKLNLQFSKVLNFKLSYRLLIGAEESIYETSLRLHHIYGIPYIPASAIKGVIRNYYINKYYEEELQTMSIEQLENNLLKDDDFIYYFGTQKKEGEIIFFDAFPVTYPKLQKDIINCHYSDYYTKDKPPTDTQKPNPFIFLTIKDCEFDFYIASQKDIDNIIIELMQEAFTNFGIGAKTAVGYGYFTKE